MGVSPCVGCINEEQLELVSHGTTAFPVACYNDDLKALPVEWHWHPEFEYILVAEGSSQITAGSQRFIIEEGDGIFINSEILHSGFLADENNCFYHSFVFHPLLIGGNFNSIYWNRYVLPLMENHSLECVHLSQKIPWQKEIIELIDSAWQAMKLEIPGYEFMVREALSKLILSVNTNYTLPHHPLSKKALRDGERMKRMMQYIAEHFTEEITTADLAHCAIISESECLRCFRSTINTTPIQYVKQFRLHKAAELLLSTDLTVSDIGNSCGFQDISYFIKSFKQSYNCTPAEYRKTED